MKNLACCFIFILHSFFAYSQPNPKLDSLKKVLSKLPKEGASFGGDTLRVRVLCEMGEEYMNSDTSLVFFKESKRLSSKIDWKKGQATALNLYARRTKKQGNFFKADSLAYQALVIAEKIKDFKQIGFAYRNIGDVCLSVNKIADAKRNYELGIKNYQIVNDENGILTCYNNIGITYYFKNEFQKSIDAYNFTIKVNKEYKLEYFDALSYNNISGSLEKLEKYNDASIYAKKAIEIYKRLGAKHNDDLSTSYASLASIFLKLKNYNEAIKNGNLAILTNKNAYYVNLRYADKVLYNTYKETGDFKKSLFYFERLKKQEDSSLSISFKQQLSANDYQYQNSRLTTDLKEQSFRQKILIGGIVIIFLFICFFWYSNLLLKTKNQLIEIQKNKILEMNINLENKVEERTFELKNANEGLIRKNTEITEALVKGQTIERKRVASELHDNLGSMLSSMKWRFETIDKANATEYERGIYNSILSMLSKAYSEVRLISHNLLPSELVENGLIGAIEKYVTEINQSSKITLNFYAHEILRIENPKVELELYSVCMEILNNILKHSEASNADILLKKSNDFLLLFVEDDGKGMTSLDKNGEGLNNIKNRIESLNGIVKIISKIGKGTKFEISIPV